MIEKVTIFVTRRGANGVDLLLFEHPSAGNQIPSGTVETGEAAEVAALREGYEETGLADLTPLHFLRVVDTELPPERRIVMTPTAVYARPRSESFDWAHFGRGTSVHVERSAADFVLVTYKEFDDLINPTYVSYQITGWVPAASLTNRTRRHFFWCDYRNPTPERWPVHDPPHHWTLFWTPLAALPPIVSPQNEWIAFLKEVVPA
jgi:ADP-ribose pyrophosphatase YjhB (NUDIX family)